MRNRICQRANLGVIVMVLDRTTNQLPPMLVRIEIRRTHREWDDFHAPRPLQTCLYCRRCVPRCPTPEQQHELVRIGFQNSFQMGNRRIRVHAVAAGDERIPRPQMERTNEIRRVLTEIEPHLRGLPARCPHGHRLGLEGHVRRIFGQHHQIWGILQVINPFVSAWASQSSTSTVRRDVKTGSGRCAVKPQRAKRVSEEVGLASVTLYH